MMDAECVVLYTHQKLKKAKTWHDGVLKVLTPGTRAILYDDKKNKIDTVHIKPEAIASGEQLESDRHLILIEEIKSGIGHDQVPVSTSQSCGREQHVVPACPRVPASTVGTGGRLSMRAGIKRRKTGFVPPRMIKQPRLDEDQTDTYGTGYNNPMVRPNPPFYTNNAQRNPDTTSILNLYSRTGAAKTTDSIRPSYKRNAEATSSLQPNTEPLVTTSPDQMSKNQSPLLGRLASDESPETVSPSLSPWSSFGAGRLKSLGSDSPKSTEEGTNKELLNGTRSSNHQVKYSRTTNFCERSRLLSEKDQNTGSCTKSAAGFVSNACVDSQRIFSRLPISGHNTATKRSASQIMALLGKSRNRYPIQTGGERQSGSQGAETLTSSSGLHVSQDDSFLTLSQKSPILPASRNSSNLPVSRNSPNLPVSRDSPNLPVSQDSPNLPVSRDSPILSVSRDSPILPVSRDSPILPVSLDSPILPVSRDSPILPVSRDSPILPVSRDSPILPISRDSPILPVSRDSPNLPVSRDSPNLPVSRDSPNLPVSRDSPILPVSRDSPNLPVSRDSPNLPVSRDSPILPVSRDSPNLPVSRDSPNLPVSRDSPILPVSRDSPNLPVSRDNSNLPVPQDSTSNCPRFVDSHKDMQLQTSVRTLYHREMQDLSSDCDISLSPSSGTLCKLPDSIVVTPEDIKEHSKLVHYNAEEETWTKETDMETKGMDRGRISQEHGSVQNCINKENESAHFHEKDLHVFTQKNIEEGIISEHEIEQYEYKSTIPGSKEELENKSTDNELAARTEYKCNEEEGPDTHLSDDDDDNSEVGQQPSFLISYSPLSQEVYSDDEDDVCGSHNTDVDLKQVTMEDKDEETQEGHIVGKKKEWKDRTSSPCKISTVEAKDSSEGNRFHNSDVDPKLNTLKDGETQEEQLVKKEEWIDKPESLDKMSSQEINIQLQDLSEGKSTELRNSQSSADKNSQVPKHERYPRDSDALGDSSVTKEQFNDLNDLNFSPDSVAFVSLSSIEVREENNRSNETSWQIKRMVPGTHVVTDIPRFAVMSPKSTNQVFSETNVSSQHPISQDMMVCPDIMREITNITPKGYGKHLLEPIHFETTSNGCTPNDHDVFDTNLEDSGKSYSLPSSGNFPSQCQEESMLQGSGESSSQIESGTTKVGRDTHLTGFVDSPFVENTSPDLVCHSPEKSCHRELPDKGMPFQYDTIPVRAAQEQDTFGESMRYKHIRPPAIMENCMGEDHLPHPSQLLRRPNVTSNPTVPTISPMDEEDPFRDRVDPGPIENAAQKLQQYKVRGSVSGGVVRRASKSTSGLDYHQTRSSTMSVMGDPTARENLFSSMSPNQSLENNSFLPDQDDRSLFIDWNVGKPKIVDMTTLSNAQDIKIPGSPYQHVPIACGSLQSYDGGSEGRNINDVPDIDFGRTRKPDNPITAESFSLSPCPSIQSSPNVFTPGCDLQNVPSESIRQPCEAESPTYGNMFKEKRNMISCELNNEVNTFGSNLDKPIVLKKEKVSLKCKPFEDSFTHTSYSSSYFSPAIVDSQFHMDNSSGVNFRSQKVIPADVDTKGQKDILDRVKFRGQMDTTKFVRHVYIDSQYDNNNNKEQIVRSEFSPEKKNDLHLSLSSVGSSDLELSFTLNEHYQGQSKPSTDLSGVNQLRTVSNIETGNLRSHAEPVDDFKSSGTCEENISCGTNQYNDSKWGKFIIKEDQDDDLIFDGSFDEQYKAKMSDDRMCFKSVNEPRKMTPEISNKQCYNKSNNDPYSKSTLTTSNICYSERLSQSDQKTGTGIHSTLKHTMSSLATSQLPTPARPLTDSKVVSPTMAEMENQISEELLMDDFDMQETEDMMINSTFSKQNSTKPDLHTVSSLVSSAAVRPGADSAAKSTGSVGFQGTSTTLSKREVFLPRQNTMKKSPSLTLASVAECDFLSQRQNTKKFHSPVPSAGLVTHVMKGSKRNISGELQFASKEEVDSNPVPLREVSISVNFPTVAVYKRVLTAVLKEHLNIILFGLAQQYHHALGMVDITNYSPAQHQGPLANKPVSMNKASSNPSCQCGVPSKMIQVKKAGNNKGRFFYACNSARNKQCKFFQWVDQAGGGRTSATGSYKLTLCEASSINTYMRGNHIMLYCECELLKKNVSDITSHFKKGVPNWVKMKYEQTNQDKKKLYIKLSKKDASSMYSKDDLWIISTTLNFHPSQSFLAKSAYFGPNSASEVEIEPLAGFSPSNWPNHAFCHALLAGNISSELCYLSNIEDNMNPASLPILPWILDSSKTGQREITQQVGFKAPVRTVISESNIFASKTSIMELAEEFIQMYRLNTDQTSALMRVCHMFCGNGKGSDTDPVLLIHGVFGAGKSFLLSVIVLFLVRLFEVSDSHTPGVPYPWKVLISSTTNVAVDRILLGLLEIGFEDFVRVGSMKKISKPVLPFSVHATGSESQELKDLQEMLRSGELTPSEKHNVRQSIEKHRLGKNKKRLSKVRVVGVTCASCTATSLDKMTFPVVLLDESSQMTEPASMLPIAKFGCEKLLLVGDPKQLDPTIQGSEAAHSNGLEQTLFDRLMKMGHTPTVLHTQYRCHPVISNLANTLFYDGQLIDGINTSDREPLVPEIPTLCFYDVSGGQEQADDGGSFYNEKEAVFVTSLIQQLLERGVEPASIGVITLYKSQMYKINTSLLTNVRGDSNKEIKATRVSTVDAFQGGEHDIIILSCVRTKGIGFIDNHKRTNVALTRARHHLLIVGKRSNLSQNKLWGQVLKLCGSQPGVVCEADTFLKQLGNTDQVRSQDRMGSTPSSPPMSLSSQETYSEACSPQHNKENADKGPESPPFTPPPADKVVPVRRKCRLINADLLECSEASDSDEDLPTF